MICSRISKWIFIALICVSAAPASAELYGTYAGLEAQIAGASDIIVLQILPPPVASNGSFVNFAMSKAGVINPETIKIVGNIKGDHFDIGTTRTIGLGSFSGITKNTSPAVVREIFPRPGDAVYLVFMKGNETINQELNMLHVKGKGPYKRKPGESVAQAITRLTGLEK